MARAAEAGIKIMYCLSRIQVCTPASTSACILVTRYIGSSHASRLMSCLQLRNGQTELVCPGVGFCTMIYSILQVITRIVAIVRISVRRVRPEA